MEARFIHEGKAIDYVPATDISAGTVVVIGDRVGVAFVDIPANVLGALQVVVAGNSNAVSGYEIDNNGVKSAIVGGNWSHATHFSGYRKVKGTEYIGWINSHGDRYKSSAEGEPADMCWMNRKNASRFCSTMHHYGPPYLVFPESVTVHDRSFYVKNPVPWPEKWRF